MARQRNMSMRRGVPVGGGGRPRANWWKQQLGTDYYSTSNRGEAYSEEYQAVLDAGVGTAPSTAIKAKDNTCINELNEAGILERLDVFYMFSTDGDSVFASLNWMAVESFKCNIMGSPTFTANGGFTGNGTSARSPLIACG